MAPEQIIESGSMREIVGSGRERAEGPPNMMQMSRGQQQPERIT